MISFYDKIIQSIILFVCIYFFIFYLKPHWLFHTNGSIRQFGIGYKNKTILPIWLLSIILGIAVYAFVNQLDISE